MQELVEEYSNRLLDFPPVCFLLKIAMIILLLILSYLRTSTSGRQEVLYGAVGEKIICCGISISLNLFLAKCK